MKVKYIVASLLGLIVASCSSNDKEAVEALRSEMMSMYGVNKTLSAIPDGLPIAYTATGIFAGTDSLDVMSFKGIPYAVQPMGTLRWKAPQPLEADSFSVREARYFGHSAVQSESFSQPASFYPQGEDCLSLSVWTANTDTTSNRPVMVYIHGGSYGWGGVCDPLFDGFNIVRDHRDIVMASINYRLGILGFIDFSSFKGGEDYKESADLGILDQIEALKWIKANISAFGGDPDNITIFGESAGGGSVSILCVSPLAKGLFAKAIAQSGSPAFTSDSEAYAALARKVKDKTGASNVSDLVNMDYEQIKYLSDELNDDNCFPLRDGHIVPLDPYKAYADGTAKDITIMTGSNKDEARYWIKGLGGMIPYTAGVNIWTEGIYKQLPESEKKDVDEFYKIVEGKEVWRRVDFLNDLFFRVPALTMADGHSKSGGETYVYFWTAARPGETESVEGACHTAELPYVFGNFSNPSAVTPQECKISKEAMEFWVNFARTGSPSDKWEKYDTLNRATMVIGDNTHLAYNLLGERRELIAPLMHQYISPLYNDMDLGVPYVYTALAILVGIVVLIIVIVVMIRRQRKKRKV